MAAPGLRVSICIGSDVFARGLMNLLLEQSTAKIEISLDRPCELAKLLKNEGVDLMILDRAYTDCIAPHLNRSLRRPRLLLVSEQYHVGARRCQLLDQACGFFPARSEEAELRELMRIVLDCPCLRPAHQTCQHCPLGSTLEPQPLPLTERELEVYSRIGHLAGPSEIAAELDVSRKTVEAHCANIKQKLGLDGSKQLLKAAIDWVEGR